MIVLAFFRLIKRGKPYLSHRIEHKCGGTAVECGGGGTRAAVSVEDGVDGGDVLAADVAAEWTSRRPV